MEKHPIFDTLSSGDLPQAHNMIFQNPSVASCRDEQANTVAMGAAKFGYIDVLVHLREIDSDLLCGTNKYEMNPAHYAALYNQHDVLHLLWQSCPDLFYQRNFWGNTPAHEAKRYGDDKTKSLLSSLVQVCSTIKLDYDLFMLTRDSVKSLPHHVPQMTFRCTMDFQPVTRHDLSSLSNFMFNSV